MASRFLPLSTWFRFGILSHIHLHAKSQKRYEDSPGRLPSKKVSKTTLEALIQHLASTVNRLRWMPVGTELADYYEDTNYSEEAADQKKRILEDFMSETRPSTVWDLGANVGAYSRAAASCGCPVVAFDLDPAAVEKIHTG